MGRWAIEYRQATIRVAARRLANRQAVSRFPLPDETDAVVEELLTQAASDVGYYENFVNLSDARYFGMARQVIETARKM